MIVDSKATQLLIRDSITNSITPPQVGVYIYIICTKLLTYSFNPRSSKRLSVNISQLIIRTNKVSLDFTRQHLFSYKVTVYLYVFSPLIED